jgi:hypothetical protein
MVFLLNLDPVIQQIIASVSFAFAGYATIIILFGPKILALAILNTDLKKGDNQNVVKRAAIIPDTATGKSSQPTAAPAAFIQTPDLSSMTSEKRVEVIKKQMKELEALLMKEIDVVSNDGASNKKAHSSYAWVMSYHEPE